MKRTILVALQIVVAASALAQSSGPYSYYALSPCRVVDTRNANGTNGGPALSPGVKRDFAFRGNCGVPATAKALSVNVTIANPSTTSWLTIWPAGGPTPVVSTINFDPNDWALANGAIVGLANTTPDLSVLNANGTVHVIVDVTGFYQ